VRKQSQHHLGSVHQRDRGRMLRDSMLTLGAFFGPVSFFNPGKLGGCFEQPVA
jgi:hypothetical protein